MKLDIQKGSRERFLAIVTLLVMAVFVVRLFFLQVVEHSYYTDLAYREQFKQLDLPAARGQIYAMDGSTPVPLVLNQAAYTVTADPYVVGDKEQKIIDVVKKEAGDKAVDNMQQLLDNKKSRYAVLAKNVSYQQAEKMKKENLPGLVFTEGSQRVYPEGQLASQVLGFVNGEGKGQYGIEGYFDKQLAGSDGVLKTVTDVRDIPLNVGSKNIDTPAKDGQNIVLTIDQNVQAQTEKIMKDIVDKRKIKNASVLVMDPQNGHILSMANYPTFNPAEYQKVQNASDFSNGTITQPYEPGSDVKTLTATAAVDQGIITPQSTYTNLDKIDVDGSIIGNATKGQTGRISIQHALNYSLNTGFVTVAQWLGGQNAQPGTAIINSKSQQVIYDYFHEKLRLGELTGVQLQGEARGIVVAPGAQTGSTVRYANMSFGQGLDATMLQVASAFGCVVNGGNYYYPTVVAGSIKGSDSTQMVAADDRAAIAGVLKPSTSETIRTMVHDARNAFYGKTDTPGYMIGGKTGTSQAIVNGTYSDTETIGTYLGFGGEIGGPARYVIMVRVSGQGQSLGGNTDAMPIFNDLSNWMLKYLKLRPKE